MKLALPDPIDDQPDKKPANQHIDEGEHPERDGHQDFDTSTDGDYLAEGDVFVRACYCGRKSCMTCSKYKKNKIKKKKKKLAATVVVKPVTVSSIHFPVHLQARAVAGYRAEVYDPGMGGDQPDATVPAEQPKGIWKIISDVVDGLGQFSEYVGYVDPTKLAINVGQKAYRAEGMNDMPLESEWRYPGYSHNQYEPSTEDILRRIHQIVGNEDDTVECRRDENGKGPDGKPAKGGRIPAHIGDYRDQRHDHDSRTPIHAPVPSPTRRAMSRAVVAPRLDM